MAALLLTVAAVLGLVIVANATGVTSVGFVVTTTLLGLGLAPLCRRLAGTPYPELPVGSYLSRVRR
ncbi:hypothetical protein [Corynebacterium diphtheriae]|uniref:hypothetical protein n=1 Tax=Corynebacterium diphtheriae TaxID=1717 RepID=UPI0013C8D0CB|nr:hypothetical protein [Corynebacterium diphtheriae]CAB0613504.1 hypothetical protein CIP107555_01863 [Corynebacterium diphtheriae]